LTNYVNNIVRDYQQERVNESNNPIKSKRKSDALQSGMKGADETLCLVVDGLGSSVSLRVDDFHFLSSVKRKMADGGLS